MLRFKNVIAFTSDMDFRKEELWAKVKGVYVGLDPDSMVTSPFGEADVYIGGFLRDRHFGPTMKAGKRDRHLYVGGTEIINRRQWSAIASEELEQIAEKMGHTEVKAEWVGANLELEGIPNLSELPPGTYIEINPGSDDAAVLMVQDQIKPCGAPGEVIAAQYAGQEPTTTFQDAAPRGKRGLVGDVDKPGNIKIGHEVRISFPHYITDAQLEPFR